MSGRTTARLDSGDWTVMVECDEQGTVGWRHLGLCTGAVPFGSADRWGADATFCLDTLADVPLISCANSGLSGPVTIDLRAADGSAVDFIPGRSTLEVGCDRLSCRMEDPLSCVAVIVTFRSLVGGGLGIEAAIENRSGRPLVVARMASAAFPVPADSSIIVSWRGNHAAEGTECAEPLPEHGWYRESRQGITGHGGPAGYYLCPPGASFDGGLTLSAQLAWSGDARLAIERLSDGTRVATLEALLQPHEIMLPPGERFEAPAALIGISPLGRNGAMAQQHAAVRGLMKWPVPLKPRPVHLNSWEACYFAQDEPTMLALAKDAALLGVERFVVDDGWFTHRTDDTLALGDWKPDPEKYPRGLAPLAREVRNLGMQFGLWVEPEMVSPDSDLHRAHPEWALAIPGRQGPRGRNQLVLDMRKPEVRDHLFGVLDGLLREMPISYLKWDHNRAHAPSGGAHQVTGAYELLSRLRNAHPSLEIESCAAGGGRCDAGIAPFVHRFWASDNLDAVSRVGIQRSFAAFLPPETMGSHVGASPAHATGRRQSLAFRAGVACMGHFGIELDPRRLREDERNELAGWIAFYKEWRAILHGGILHLGTGSDGLRWQAHGDGDQWLLFAIRTEPSNHKRPQPLRLPFLAGTQWKASLLRLVGVNRWLGTRPWTIGHAAADFDGDWLAVVGLPLPPMSGEAVAIFHLGSGT